MAVIETWLRQDLISLVSVQNLPGHIFTQDNQANRIGVEVTKNGVPVNLSGTCTGYVIRSDGKTVVMYGEISGNKASILLPAACYAVIGNINIVLKVEGTTLLACTGYVYRTTTDTIVDPGTVVPNITELLDMIDDCEEATDAANNAAADAEIAAESISHILPEKEAEPGSIVSFYDAAEAMPLKALTFSIEPVQDLHGYDHPWPAGGGKNLLNINASTTTINGVTYTIESDGTVKLSGTATNRSVYKLAENFLIKAGTYKINGAPQTLPVSCYLNFNGGGISASESNSQFDAEFVLSEDVTTDYVRIDIASGTNTNGLVFKPMIRLASVTDGTFAPYSNICPINGWTGANVYRTGVNVWDEEWEQGGYNAGTGAKQGNSDAIRSKTYIPVSPNTTYSMVSKTTAATWVVVEYDANKTYLGWLLWGGTAKLAREFTTGANAAYINFHTTSLGTTYNHDISINYPAIDTDYHAYTGQVYPITFPDSAGTVYGGTVDLAAQTLTVDRAMQSFTWGDGTSATDLGNYVRKKFVLSNTPIDYAYIPEPDLCNIAPISSEYSADKLHFYVNRSNAAAFVFLPETTDSSTEIQVCYHLETPLTYQLDPARITTLLGENHIWVDTGDISECAYQMDLTTHVKQLISEDPDLNEKIDGKAPIIVGSGSGELVSFSDGADGIPLKECVANIDPVQDLHGYDNPWPAGGGKNIAPYSVGSSLLVGYQSMLWKNGYMSNSATSTSMGFSFTRINNNYGCGIVLGKLEEGQAYTIKATRSDPGWTCNIAIFDADAVLSLGTGVSRTVVQSGVNIENGYTFIALGGNIKYAMNFYDSTVDKSTLEVSNIQLEIGSIATEWTPYSNICPISGHTGANVYRTGVNIFDGELEKAAINWATGVFTPSPNGRWASKNYISVKPGKSYYISHRADNVLVAYDDDSGNGGQIVLADSNTKIFTIPAGKHYMKFGINVSDEPTNICINYPATNTTYQPGQIQSVAITFPDSAGTVYGGSLTVNEDGTGRLVVDANTFDMGDVNWTEYGESYPNLFYTIFTNAILPPNNFTIAQIKSTIYHVAASQNIGNVGYTNGYIGLNTGGRLYVNDVRYSSKQDFVSGVTGQKVWYKLATPITYDLTAEEVGQIMTLKGYNAIWADTGAISLTYPADTKSYVDDRTPVQDVQINGTSILSNGVANVPVASDSAYGVIKTGSGTGITVNSRGVIAVSASGSATIKAGINAKEPITPYYLRGAIYYGLAKLAGADMASLSGETIGVYPEAQKIAIQKMLGIYQAPWELIREDTVTNATEADINITVDGNGQAFELTDVIIVLIVPNHSEDTTIGDFGRLYLYNNATEIRRIYLLNSASKLIQANSTPQIAIGRLLNNNGMMSIDLYMWTEQSNRSNLQIVPNSDLNGISTPFAINANYINTIKIGKITGKLQYRLYGRRKWT